MRKKERGRGGRGWREKEREREGEEVRGRRKEREGEEKVGRRKERDARNRRGIEGKWRRADVGGEGRREEDKETGKANKSLFSSTAESLFFLYISLVRWNSTVTI
jgi:hypothetical protein